jgi:hypothetical protein
MLHELLECVTARYWHQCTPDQKANNPDGKRAAKGIFHFYCEELTMSYQNSVLKQRKDMNREEFETGVANGETAERAGRQQARTATEDYPPLPLRSKTLSQAISEVANEIKDFDNKAPFTRKACGQIARFIRAAWVHQAKIVVWEENDNRKESSEKEDTSYLKIPDPKRFPDMSAVGGV